MGEILPLYSILPFAGMLISISGMPLIAPRFWHRHYGKISLIWALAAALPMVWVYGQSAAAEFNYVLAADYLPFVILLWALYTVSGGILIRGALSGTPLSNILLLAAGSCLASLVGTTGAAMLLVRPFIRANSWRKQRTFMLVFFIFLVANIGGSLTPLGDPPLFLGFLHGVPVCWTLGLWPETATAAFIILGLYLCLDIYHYRGEEKPVDNDVARETLQIEGKINLIFFAGIIGATLLSGLADMGESSVFGVRRANSHLVRDLIFILMGAGSIIFTRKAVRERNEFSWLPMIEIGYLFFGIFISMVPCLLILRAGERGPLGPLILGVKSPAQFFWATGMLSSVLDNAPTYLAFLNTALGRLYPGQAEPEAVRRMLGEAGIYLKAISCGAVFMGANTYIGNAPNFMVRSIAEEMGTAMPSFFGYIFKYSLPILGLTFLVITMVFFI